MYFFITDVFTVSFQIFSLFYDKLSILFFFFIWLIVPEKT